MPNKNSMHLANDSKCQYPSVSLHSTSEVNGELQMNKTGISFRFSCSTTKPPSYLVPQDLRRLSYLRCEKVV